MLQSIIGRSIRLHDRSNFCAHRIKGETNAAIRTNRERVFAKARDTDDYPGHGCLRSRLCDGQANPPGTGIRGRSNGNRWVLTDRLAIGGTAGKASILAANHDRVYRSGFNDGLLHDIYGHSVELIRDAGGKPACRSAWPVLGIVVFDDRVHLPPSLSASSRTVRTGGCEFLFWRDTRHPSRAEQAYYRDRFRMFRNTSRHTDLFN